MEMLHGMTVGLTCTSLVPAGQRKVPHPGPQHSLLGEMYLGAPLQSEEDLGQHLQDVSPLPHKPKSSLEVESGFWARLAEGT